MRLATVYLSGKFAGNFDVAYYALLKPAANVGLASNGAGSSAVTPFTDVTYPTNKSTYEASKTNCNNGCIIELRGDAKNLYAYISDKLLATWPRAALQLNDPSFQLNAEAHGAGDTIDGTLSPVRLTAAGHAVKPPTCAFTTRGVEPSGRTTLTFHGVNKTADGEYVSLSTGVHADKC